MATMRPIARVTVEYLDGSTTDYVFGDVNNAMHRTDTTTMEPSGSFPKTEFDRHVISWRTPDRDVPRSSS